MELANDKLGVRWTIIELRQRHVEQFSELVKALPELPMPKFRGQVVRIAIDCGWISAPAITNAEVADMKPAAVRWLSEQLTDLYVAANEIDPKV